MNAPIPSADRNDDTACFDRLYANHHRVVYAYLLGQVENTDSAADLLQETFVRVWRHLHDARQIAEERQRFWLFAIVRNLLLDYGRRQTARKRCEDSLRESAIAIPNDGDPAKTVLAKESAAAVDAAIARLPDDLRLVLTLNLVGGMTSAEIGSSLNRPAGTVRYQLSRARERIAQELARIEQPIHQEETDAR